MVDVVIDDTHDPKALSWVPSANDPGTDFPIQNLPFGRYRRAPGTEWRICVAIGDQLLDLEKAGVLDHQDMARVMQLSAVDRRALRGTIFAGLLHQHAPSSRWRDGLLPQTSVELGLPCEIGDYTDFYVGIHHATAVGKLFRPDAPLLPNYEWVPIGYHGRASSIVPSGRGVVRPSGQVKAADAGTPTLRPSARLDCELELAIFIGQGNDQGQPIPIDEAGEHVFGLGLFNDWSARDIQSWEYQPLGPFLSKNFASTLSPWIVTTEALAPFRRGVERPAGRPAPLQYLDNAGDQGHGAFSVDLEIWFQSAAMRAAGLAPTRISTSSFDRAAYWTPAQLVAHHTVNGCNLRTGDLLGTGTLSGEGREEAGSLLELTEGGSTPIVLPNGERRTFLEDGDRLELRAHCERPGFRRIGFGLCSGEVLASRAPKSMEKR